jgi:cytochrome b
MNETSVFPAEPGISQPAATRGVLVWDFPVRVFHWLLALNFAIAWVTAESETWRLVHLTAGYTVAGLVAFRLIWGLVGTRHARFASFIRGPRAVFDYLKNTLRGEHPGHAGHNPAGALAIVGLLTLAALTAASGWAFYNEFGGEWLGELHEGLANVMLGLILLHLAAVLVTSILARENLVKAMWTGRKQSAHEGDGIARPWHSLGVLMLVMVAGFWTWQLSQGPGVTGLPSLSSLSGERQHHGHHEHDD